MPCDSRVLPQKVAYPKHRSRLSWVKGLYKILPKRKIDDAIDEFLKDIIPTQEDEYALEKMEGFLEGCFDSEEEILAWLYNDEENE